MVHLVLSITLLIVLTVVSADLRSDLTGKGFSNLFPGDPGYSSASQAFNLRFTLEPAVITFPSTPQHVSIIIKTGSKYNYNVVARSGGHSYIASGLGGKNGTVVADLQKFNNIVVNSSSGTAIIEMGSRLGDIALALNDKGRALPHGTCPYVGIGGHAGYGGYGFTSRKWGLTLDTIIAINVVLANGTIMTTSSSRIPDLFWALRGSAGSFGVTTSISVNTFAAPPSATVFQLSWNLNAADAAKALGTFQDYVLTNIPLEFGAEIVVKKGPVRGSVSFALAGGWYAPANELNATLAPFLKGMPKPSSSSFQVGSYIDSVANLGFGDPLNTSSAPDWHDTFYAKSLMTPESSPISDIARMAFMSILANKGFDADTNWFVEIQHYGGPNSAINAMPTDATAFAHRSSMFTIQFYTSVNQGILFPESGFTFLDDVVNSIVKNSPPNWDYGAYLNYMDDRLQNAHQLYYGSHYARLQWLKEIYDPSSIFSFPTSIQA